jgi:hypothetical protein
VGQRNRLPRSIRLCAYSASSGSTIPNITIARVASPRSAVAPANTTTLPINLLIAGSHAHRGEPIGHPVTNDDRSVADRFLSSVAKRRSATHISGRLEEWHYSSRGDFPHRHRARSPNLAIERVARSDRGRDLEVSDDNVVANRGETLHGHTFRCGSRRIRACHDHRRPLGHLTPRQPTRLSSPWPSPCGAARGCLCPNRGSGTALEGHLRHLYQSQATTMRSSGFSGASPKGRWNAWPVFFGLLANAIAYRPAPRCTSTSASSSTWTSSSTTAALR